MARKGNPWFMSETPRASALPLLAGAGFYAGLGQVILLRQLLNIAAGNELTIGLMLAIWLLSAALGAWWAGRVGSRLDDGRRLMNYLFGMTGLTWLVLLIGVDVAWCAPSLLQLLPGGLGAEAGEVLGLGQLVLVTAAVVAPSALLSGALFAGALRLNALQGGDTALSVGQAYAADAAGHLLGGVTAALLILAGLNPPLQTVVAGAVVVLGGVLVESAAQGDNVRRIIARACLFVVIVGLWAWIAPRVHRTNLRIRRAGQHLLTQVDTIYGNLAVTEFGPDGVYFYRDGVPDSCSPPTPGIQYLVHFPLLQSPAPKTVLLIGGGATGGLQEVLKHSPTSVAYVELDPMLIRLARAFVVGADQKALSDPRVQVHNVDGRLFVKQAGRQGRQYDAVIVSLPEPGTAQLNRFYTRDFFQEVKRVLRPGRGVFGLQIPSSETYLGDELLRLNTVMYRTLKEVFPQLALLPGEELVIAASPDVALSEDAVVLRQRLKTRHITAPDFQAHVWDRLFPFSLDQLRGDLDAAPWVAPNTDAMPVGYFYGQAYWVAQHSRSSWAVFDALSRLKGRHLLALTLLGLLVLWVAGRVSRRARAAVPLTVLGSGAVAMALEVTLLLAFQVYYGFVYLEVGIITGAFMVGLALGGWRTARFVTDLETDECYRLLAVVQGGIALIAFALPALLALLAEASGVAWAAAVLPHVVFPALTAVIGFAVGTEFPLASRAAGATGQARAGAVLYAMDLGGAALGALVAGTVVLPVLGLTGTCVVAGAVSVALEVLLVVQTPKLELPACGGCATGPE